MNNLRINYFILPLLIICTFLCSINAQGIKFEQGLTWQQLKEKAQKENKYIFIDCFATWCGPCKQMEKEVYNSEKVAKIFNQSFISIKLQMDTTKEDDEQIRNNYDLASTIASQYKIQVLPTYLFFSPEGKIVDKFFGYLKEVDFLALANNSLNPAKQYYTLLENYNLGKRDYSILGNTALKARYLGDEEVANEIARDYINNYLSGLSEKDLYTPKNISFIQEFLTTNEKYFNIFYTHRKEIDSSMNEKGYAQKVIDRVIYIETIYPILKVATDNNTQPNWDEISKLTQDKYGIDDGQRNILSAKVKWLEYKGNWQQYTKTVMEWVNRYKENFNSFELNTYAWNIFSYSNDKAYLDSALNWSSRSIELCPATNAIQVPNLLDTKANLLYKLGKISEAITLEERAISLAIELKNDAHAKELTKVLMKMKKGNPTWDLPKE